MDIDNQKKQIDIFLSYLMGAMILYFLYHIFAGRYGIISFVNSRSILNEKQKIMRSVVKDMELRRGKINKMKGDYVDADLLDEEIRKKFGYANDNEIVIFSKDLEERN